MWALQGCARIRQPLRKQADRAFGLGMGPIVREISYACYLPVAKSVLTMGRGHMTAQDLYRAAERLERRVEGASLNTRLELQPEFSKIMDRMRQQGLKVPARLRQLDAALCEDAVEAQFDNMPV
ncbi:hypothetical protein SPO1031 [Ruegeria pomeroyi DSS-3]|uniref:Uncharacterized protein n=2 Tax=Ruegeria pomeroyi TaxID=89184 RepID=Q5LUM2_RUEPO|nr:hypothetical protein SPO1031 [Ruegeria pomeroyi DSS-3]